MKLCHLTAPSVFLVFCLFSVFKGGCCCGILWLKYEDRCFRIFPPRVTHHHAMLRCLLEGSELASISDESVLGFMAQHAAQTIGDKYWVGLEKDPKTSHFKWRDGTLDVENDPWLRVKDGNYSESPSNNYGRGCFAYNGALVTNVACNERIGIICGHKVESIENRTWCNMHVPHMHTFIGDTTGNCLFKAPEKTTYSKADELCHGHGGRLADLHDMMIDGLSAFYDHQLLTNDGSKFWTRFKWNGTDLFWSFGDHLPKEYPIKVTEGSGSCIAMQFNFTDALEPQFYQMECDDQADVVCTKVLIRLVEEATTPYAGDIDGFYMDDPQLSCPEGYNWKTDSNKDYCYWETSYETAHLSWQDAETYCQSFGGNLGSFHSVEEEKIGLSFQYGSLAHPYWIGLSLDVDTETYKWSDGSALDYSNWAPGHPDHKDKRLKCVAMEAQEKHWVSSLCGILSWFICKVPKRTYHSPSVLPTPAPLEICEKYAAGNNLASYRFQEACYFAVSETFSWHRAKEYCENEGSTLVSIHSGEEIGFLLKLLHESVMESNRVWIGLNSFGSDDSFHWTDWSAVDFTFFSDKEPNNYQNQEKCCNMYTRNGQWNDENCNAPMGFICKRITGNSSSTTVPSTPDPRIGNCKKGWIPYTDRCYYLGGLREKDRVNWTTAGENCQKEGGYLTSIRDERDQAFLSYIIQRLGVDAWIGLHDTIQSGRYYWLDNSELKYTRWAPGEPSFFGITEDCVKMVYDHLDSGVWKDDDCDRKFGYICQNRKDPQLPAPSYDRGVNCPQPEGWLQLDTLCFKMFEGSTLSWKEAESACQKDGGHLVSVSDQKVKAAVSYLATEVNQPFFIGLKYEKDSQKIRWLNDRPVLLSNWEKNEPSFLDDSTCFASTSEGYWKKISCDEEMPFICEITTGEPVKQKRYTGNCPATSKHWTPGSNSYCYILENEHRVDWFTSNLMCFRHGTHLVSIHSKSENEDLKKLMKSGIRSVYIGLMRNKKNGFTWTDDSPVDFENWDENEPANSEDQCVEMVVSTMKWRVTDCIVKKHFVCQDEKDTLVYGDPQNAEFAEKQEQTGMSTADICAIVVGVLIVIVLIVVVVRYRKKCYRTPQFRRHVPDQSISFENALYRVGNANMEFHEENRNSL